MVLIWCGVLCGWLDGCKGGRLPCVVVCVLCGVSCTLRLMSSPIPLKGRSTILCDFMGSSCFTTLAAACCACCIASATPSGSGAAPDAAEH